MKFKHVIFGNKDLDIYRECAGAGYPWLAVRDSLMMQQHLHMPGKGLYALRNFKPGEIIGRYSGKLVAHAVDADNLESNSDKLLIMQGIIVDGGQPPQSACEQKQAFGKVVYDPHVWQYPGMYHFMANDARNTPMQNNAMLDGRGFMVITQPVKAYKEGNCAKQNAKSELFWSYGDAYWKV